MLRAVRSRQGRTGGSVMTQFATIASKQGIMDFPPWVASWQLGNDQEWGLVSATTLPLTQQHRSGRASNTSGRPPAAELRVCLTLLSPDVANEASPKMKHK